MILKNYLNGRYTFIALFIFALTAFSAQEALAQCPNDNTSFGSSAAPTVNDVTTTLTSCIFGGEYRVVTGLQAGFVYEFSTCGDTDFDTQVTIYAAGGGPSVAYNDDACGLQSVVQFAPTVDGDYWVLVDEFNCVSNSDCMTLSVTRLGPPANDDACNAEMLTMGVPANVNNVLATVEQYEPSPGPGTGTSSCNSDDGWCSFETDVDNSVWYTFIGPASGCVSISTEFSDLQLAVYTTPLCSKFFYYQEVAANDDSGPVFAPLLENLSVTPGQEYYVQVDGFGGTTTTDDQILVTDGAGPIPAPWASAHIAPAVGDFSYVDCGETFTMSSNGYSSPFTDQGGYVTQTLCGNGYIQARLDDIDGSGWAGIVMRESLSGNSKKIALKSRLSTFVRRDLRKSSPGWAQSKQYPRPTGWNWLRLERIDDQFVGFVSEDGQNWQQVMAVFVPMNNCLQVGMFVESINVNAVTTATFSTPEVGLCPCISTLGANFAQLDGQLENTISDINKLTLFPNPSSGLINLEVSDFMDKSGEAIIYNSLGQIVWAQKYDAIETPTISADLQSDKIANGIYQLVFISDGEKIAKPFVINK
jgi:hypothetical protein